MKNDVPAMIGFTAPSGTGKTSLIEKLLPLFAEKKYPTAVIKRSHHPVELDTPGKDSYRFRQAGAQQVLLSTPKQWLLSKAHPNASPTLAEAIEMVTLTNRYCRLILVEGYHEVAFPKIEIYRSSLEHPPLYSADKNIIAIASDTQLPASSIPVLPLNDAPAIAAFIERLFGLYQPM